jgi:hypothetical protein
LGRRKGHEQRGARFASVSDGLSSTAFYSERIKGIGSGNNDNLRDNPQPSASNFTATGAGESRHPE